MGDSYRLPPIFHMFMVYATTLRMYKEIIDIIRNICLRYKGVKTFKYQDSCFNNQQNSNNVLFINVIHVLIAVVAAFLLVLGIIGAITFVRNYSFSSRRRRGASIKIKRPKKSRRKRRRNNGLHDSW